jgi:hypothetical protein
MGRMLVVALLIALPGQAPWTRLAPGSPPSGQDSYEDLLERLRQESPGEYEKVKQLDRDTGLRFLRERYAAKGEKADPGPKKEKAPELLPARRETFTVLETLAVGDCAVELCRREDGAFGLGAVRRGTLALRRADFLATWSVAGRAPAFTERRGNLVLLRDPDASLEFFPETRESAGAAFSGLRMRFTAAKGPVVETASWEPGGSAKGLSYFDGYRGWHAPPDWVRADAVPPTNPKRMPSLLHGTGFQVLHGRDGALLHFHTAPGDRLKNASRGEALEFETTYHGPTTIDRFVLAGPGGSRINLWTRAFEIAHGELRRAFEIPARRREILLLWPVFSRRGFAETARVCAEVTAREGFTGACIDVVWDNLEFHGGAKNMNVWSLEVCEGYGGGKGLKALVEECRKHKLLVIPWVPTAHLVDRSDVWTKNPGWRLGVDTPSRTKGGTGPVYGDLESGFGEYFRDRVAGAIRTYGFDGAWMDSHLSGAGQPPAKPNSARLAAIYREFIKAGARHMIVEGDASVFGGYGIGIDESWGRIPEPDLYLDSNLLGWGNDPELYTRHFRRWVAAGAAWVVAWDMLLSPKLAGEGWEAARREVRSVLKDYARVKDRMTHRFAHDDGSGYTWTDGKGGKVVWLLKDAALPDGRRGEGGRVYVIDK